MEPTSGANAVEIVPVDATDDRARQAMGRYFAELDARFEQGFDPGTGGADDDADSMRQPNGVFLLAVSLDRVLACGGLRRIDDDTAEIKRMWVDPEHRGRGIGRRLLDALESEARRRSCRRVVLDTNRVLTEAVAMYERTGYVAVERYNDNPFAHHWFAKDL